MVADLELGSVADHLLRRVGLEVADSGEALVETEVALVTEAVSEVVVVDLEAEEVVSKEEEVGMVQDAAGSAIKVTDTHHLTVHLRVPGVVAEVLVEVVEGTVEALIEMASLTGWVMVVAVLMTEVPVAAIWSPFDPEATGMLTTAATTTEALVILAMCPCAIVMMDVAIGMVDTPGRESTTEGTRTRGREAKGTDRI